MEAFGPVLHNLYGSTECAVATVAMPADWQAAPGTAGLPPVGCQVRLYDESDRVVTEPGITGRIFVGNGLSFGGYSGGGHKDMIDGLLSTGDLGHLDSAGRLFVDGRDLPVSPLPRPETNHNLLTCKEGGRVAPLLCSWDQVRRR